MTNLKKVLNEIKNNLADIYGKRLIRIVLYGSFARKEATEFSDLDVLVLLDNFSNVGEEIERLSTLSSDLSLKHDITIALMPAREKDFVAKKTILLRNVYQEGIAI